MEDNLIVQKSKAFALRVIKLYQYLQDKGERVMSKQLLRSGTSIGANIAEGQYAQSKADFLTKYSIALKEASETRYWLELLIESKILSDSGSSRSLLSDNTELIRLLVSSTKRLKGAQDGFNSCFFQMLSL